ncbi:MAG: tetratricopeptide repeat protein [Ignavibacteriales bacterium]|nr:tetratricopeptide repeat protein [Ignavibacteriales bacterium]
MKAEKLYNASIKGDSLFYPAKSNLALLYYNQGRLNEAEKLYLDLIKKNREYTEGFYQLGLLYAEQKRYQRSYCVFRTSSTSQPGASNRIYYNLGLIYQYLNDDKKAESSLLKANSNSPNDFDILYATRRFLC